MEQVHRLLIQVWREACRHIDIADSAGRIATIVAQHSPIDRLVVLAFDPSCDQIIPRAEALNDRAPSLTPRLLNRKDKRLLQQWLRAPALLRHDEGEGDPMITILLGQSSTRGWIAAALESDNGTRGALLLRVRSNKRLTTSHEELVELLREPFSAALENDGRLHELNALREAAEADKRSALSRLGRDDLVGAIIGCDNGLKPVMQRVAVVAKSDLPVLILGETGSGKEVIARAIHDQSPRAARPFIRVNCGAIPAELIDSELFGHEKGAFTGATSLRRGWFERAHEGTLFLDEIGELPLPAQVRLLRVLQEGTFERVGGESPVHVNVRIIAATHRDLPHMIRERKFREDLWYRVAGFPIVLPPLRERRSDIPALAEHFAQRAARRFGLRPQTPSEHDLALLIAYDWPGNVRELASVIDRAAILGEGESLEISKALGTAMNHDANRVTERASVSSGPIVTLDDAMRRHIELALSATRGRIEGPHGAAKLLNINPHTLRARMRKLGIEWEAFRSVIQ